MNLTPEQSQQRLHELRQILCQWDPIGVMEDPDWPRDEYDSYLVPIMSYLEQNAPETAISNYLDSVVTRLMGMSPNPSRSKAYAAKIVAWYKERWDGTSV